MQEILLLFLEKICEAIFFSLFIIYGKNLKEKRVLFTLIMIFEYLIFKQFFSYNIWFNIIYTFMSFVNLKVLYKEKAQITDIFLFAAASVILIILSTFAYFIVFFTIKKYLVAIILSRILMFLFLIISKSKINKIYTNFYLLWNRHSNKNKIRSLTLRNISIIIFNFMFWFLNIALTISILIGKR